MKMILEGEVNEITELLRDITVRNEIPKVKFTTAYPIDNVPLELIFDEFKTQR